MYNVRTDISVSGLSAYDFGMFEGVTRTSAQQQGGVSSTFDFRWRGMENIEHVISYDDGCQSGEISLDYGGVMCGMFRGLYGDVSFRGIGARHPTGIRWSSGRLESELKLYRKGGI